MEKYIEVTLKSIINQNYNDLELIIIDGGSTDNTLSIIDRYNDYINVLVSEPDLGQYNAVNKGMKLATGDVFAWINADDMYFPWTFKHVSDFFKKFPDQQWISGANALMDNDGVVHSLNRNIIAKPNEFIKNGWFRKGLFGYLQQEGMFWRRELWEKSKGLNEEYVLAADYDLWIRFSNNCELVSFGIPLACFRIRSNSRSVSMEEKYYNEVSLIYSKLKKPSFLLRFFGKKSIATNILIRKLIIKSSLIYYFSPLLKQWILKRKKTSLGTYTLTQLLSLR